MKVIRRNRLLSQYPHLYSNTYWAYNSYDTNDAFWMNEEVILCKNRDLIAQKYGFQKYLDSYDLEKNKKYKQYFEVIAPLRGEVRDHIEYYKTNDNNIACIISNYENEDHAILLISKGYTEIEPVYSTSCTSYIKIVNPKTGVIIVL